MDYSTVNVQLVIAICEEKVEITSGFIEVKIHPSCSWVRYGEGEFYVLPASTSFELQCKEIVEYVCSYSNN